MEAVKCKGVSFTYPNNEKPSLKDISFEVDKGEFCLLLGASAAGKSTLLKLLKKEIAPAGKLTGEIFVDKNVAYVSQNVDENIVCDRVRSELAFALMNKGLDGDEINLLTAETASYFNLENNLDDEISTLSSGEKQIVNLASVMIMKPDVLLLDEPCARLDPVSVERFINVVKKLHDDFNVTVIISEHNSNAVFDFADSVILLESSLMLIKDSPIAVCEYLKQNKNKMLSAVPLKYRLKNYTVKPYVKDTSPCRTALKCRNVCYAYEKGKEVLSSLSLDIYENKINGIVGANGSGKSTLLKVLSGVCKKQSGRIKCSHKISMLTQNVYDLFTCEKCSQETEFGKLTDFLEISYIKNKHPYDLSGGEAQRLALAMALEKNADLILLDEPTASLDAPMKIKFGSLLQKLCKEGKTIVIVTHDIDFAGRYCDCCSFISRGQIITTKSRREFFSELNFYTTSVSKFTHGKCVSLEDLNEQN